jgi:uncharacterized membrane protein
MSTWKRHLGDVARRGFGGSLVDRWIGRQRREAARPTGRTLPALAPSVLAGLTMELAFAEAAESTLVAAYERLRPWAPREVLDALRDAAQASGETHARARIAWRAARSI